MLIFHKPVPAKAPKRRSRAGCIHCKEKKKKCNEQRPQCDRCIEKNIPCEYEPVKPRKKRRTSMVLSTGGRSPRFKSHHWSTQFGQDGVHDDQFFFSTDISQWDTASSYAYTDPGYDQDSPFDVDIEEIARRDSTGTSLPIATFAGSRSPVMDLAMIAPSPVASPLLEFSAPMFMEFAEKKNRRGLVDHFCNVLSHLIVFKEDTGNPFRQLVLPLSHSSAPVMNAIFALSSAHLEFRGIENPEKSLDFHNRALQGLAKLIDQGAAANREEVLGAIILLVYYEVLVQRGTTNIISGHLKGAMTIMRSKPHDQSPTSIFLERAFRFYDVIAALSFGTSPISSTPPALSPFALPSAPNVSPFGSVDTLLGMATDLWPIIHRLSNLLEAQAEIQEAEMAGNTSKATVLRTELESTSHAIQLALTNWSPSISPASLASSSNTTDGESDPAADARMQSISNNAEAYRQAALVYLYRYVKQCSRRSQNVQRHTRLTLKACGMVVEWAGPMSALLWPLFISACEAVDSEDRDLARNAFGGTDRRQGMRNIVRAWEVVEEVWKKDDEGEEVCWRQVCAEKGFSIVFG